MHVQGSPNVNYLCFTVGKEGTFNYDILIIVVESRIMPNCTTNLTLRLLMSYIYGAPSKARNVNVVYIWTYVWQR